MTTFAVVPACGHSTRMGRPKLSLPLGGRAVIEHVVGALRDGGVDRVLVVVGPHVPELVPLAAAAGAEVLPLPEPTADMRATVEAGLRHLEDRYRPAADDLWLLVPADHPTLSAGLVRQLLDVARNSSHTIAIPTVQGRRGHPAAIRWHHVAGIRALPPDEGINAYFRRHAAAVLEYRVTDAGAVADLDTPADYERLRGGSPAAG